MTSALSRDLIFLIFQFLDEEKYRGTFHRLEQESGFYFNVNYFEEIIMNGDWDEVEKYLSGFTKLDDNKYSMKMFFEIRKQKYLEALDKNDRAKAVDILIKDLKVFSTFNVDLFKEITQLITLENFRETEPLKGYRDAKTARAAMFTELKPLIEGNPLLRDKLRFPVIKGARLRMLINQSLNWQHSLCGNPRQNPDIKTLFVDHNCRNANDAYAHLAANNQLIGSAPKTEGFLLPMAPNAHQLFQPSPTALPPVQPPLTTWMSNPATINHPSLHGGGLSFGSLNPGMVAIPKGPGDSDASRPRISGFSDRMILPGSNSGQNHNGGAFSTVDELPKTVARTLNQGSVPTSMDFHPIQQTLLLVGTLIGDVSLWEVSSREKLLSKTFQVWDIGASSMTLKASIVKDPSVSVRRVLWSADGSLFGVAHSKHVVQLYTYHGGKDIKNHLEIDAHVGSVNDIAFCNPHKQLSVITCGDDKTIKVWDVATGAKLFTLEGHDAPVHSICPYSRENVHFIFSTSVDGKIKAWLYDSTGSKLDFNAPGLACTTLAYTADGKRLFSCGTNQGGASHMVEWNEKEGTIKRSYHGLKRARGVIQFDIGKNKFLAAGDDYSIKFWDMNNPDILTMTDAEGGIPANPRIRFNKEGTLLAVSANDHKIKILATIDGLRLMRATEGQPLPASRFGIASENLTMNGDVKKLEEIKPRLPEETKVWKFVDINDPSRLRSLKLSAHVKTDKIPRLTYTNSGNGIMALASNGIHLLWRWLQTDPQQSGKVTTKITPHLFQPPSGILMTNDVPEANKEEVLPCFAMSKNDSYIMSASGGKVSLFNTMTFKTMATFIPPPPVATYLAFHPQDNNIVAIGVDDATILIYNVRADEAKCKLKSHSKRITGLAFSTALNVLVSSGADSQIVVWSCDKWERQKNTFVQLPAGKVAPPLSNTQVQFHQNQTHILVVHEMQLAIYEMTKFECIKQWTVEDFSAPISSATFSCDSQLVYSSFMDGTVRIFSSFNLEARIQISPSAYLPSDISSTVYPLAIAASTREPEQFTIGLTDGSVIVLEPLESVGRWNLTTPHSENGSASNHPPPASTIISLDQNH
ncbi:topless-related protein 1-like [Euphorbia lathyris]|uniref:topless-related protein 1-like n=1 Tax=Euphorbia lathyris TaxID=212925 RepID=UPI003313C90D